MKQNGNKMKEIQNDAFNREINTNEENILLEKEEIEEQTTPPLNIQQFQQIPQFHPSQQFLQQQLQQHQINQLQQQQVTYQKQYQQAQKVPHKYSREYAQYIGQQARAQASVKIKLGGVV
jgi:hypothetical protein